MCGVWCEDGLAAGERRAQDGLAQQGMGRARRTDRQTDKGDPQTTEQRQNTVIGGSAGRKRANDGMALPSYSNWVRNPPNPLEHAVLAVPEREHPTDALGRKRDLERDSLSPPHFLRMYSLRQVPDPNAVEFSRLQRLCCLKSWGLAAAVPAPQSTPLLATFSSEPWAVSVVLTGGYWWSGTVVIVVFPYYV